MRHVLVCMRRCAAVGALAFLPAAAQAAGPVNLCVNGDFEQVDAQTHLPVGWRGHPPGERNVCLIDDPARGKVLQLSGGAGLMGGPGVFLMQTRDIPYKANTLYRVTGWTKSAGPSIIVFVKGFGLVVHNADPQRKKVHEEVYMMKKEVAGPDVDIGCRDWEPFSLDFEVRPMREFSDFQHRVDFFRVKLFAYWPPGTCWLDDVRVEEVGLIPVHDRLDPEAVTHLKIKPNLDAPQAEAFDEEQCYVDAQNAWLRKDYAACHRLSMELVGKVGDKGVYRLLAARAAIELGKARQADEQAEWILQAEGEDNPLAKDRRIESWQYDFARLIRAQAVLAADAARGVRMLEALAQATQSPHVRVFAAAAIKKAAQQPAPASPASKPAATAPATAPACENFRSKAWYGLGRGGAWKIVSDSEIRQLKGKPYVNNGYNRKVDQAGRMTWAFDIQVDDGACGAGIYVMANDEKGIDRGDSYLLWFKHKKDGDKLHGQFLIGKHVKNRKVKAWRPAFDLATRPDEWARLRVDYDAATGKFVVCCQDKKIGEAVDPEPIRAGDHVSLHTCLTGARYRNLRIIRAGK